MHTCSPLSIEHVLFHYNCVCLHLFLYVVVFFFSFLQQCQYAKLKLQMVWVSVHCSMNYPLSTLWTWLMPTSSVSAGSCCHAACHLELCHSKEENMFVTTLFVDSSEQNRTVSLTEMALYSRCIMLERVIQSFSLYVDTCALKYASSCYILQVVQYCFIFFVLHSL